MFAGLVGNSRNFDEDGQLNRFVVIVTDAGVNEDGAIALDRSVTAVHVPEDMQSWFHTSDRFEQLLVADMFAFLDPIENLERRSMRDQDIDLFRDRRIVCPGTDWSAKLKSPVAGIGRPGRAPEDQPFNGDCGAAEIESPSVGADTLNVFLRAVWMRLEFLVVVTGDEDDVARPLLRFDEEFGEPLQLFVRAVYSEVAGDYEYVALRNFHRKCVNVTNVAYAHRLSFVRGDAPLNASARRYMPRRQHRIRCQKSDNKLRTGAGETPALPDPTGPDAAEPNAVPELGPSGAPASGTERLTRHGKRDCSRRCSRLCLLPQAK